MSEEKTKSIIEETELFIDWLEEMENVMDGVVKKPGFLELGAVDTLKLYNVVKHRLRDEKITLARYRETEAAARAGQNAEPVMTEPERARAEGMMTALGVVEALLGNSTRIIEATPHPGVSQAHVDALVTLFGTVTEATLAQAARQMGIIRKTNTMAETDAGIFGGLSMAINLGQFRQFVANGSAAEREG